MALPFRRPPNTSLHAAPVFGAAPFVVEERQENVQRTGAFTPNAVLWLSPALLGSGLLKSLSPEEWHLLLGVLAHLTPNGTFIATPGSLARALGLPPRTVAIRLGRLLSAQWEDGPILREHTVPSGLRFIAPAPRLLSVRRSRIALPLEGALLWQETDIPVEQQGKRVPREEAINHSRALYARPRAEVEADIERFLQGEHRNPNTNAETTLPPGIASVRPEEVSSEATHWLTLKRALVSLGVPHRRADELLQSFPFERIERQLKWLPYRGARNPIAYLLAAIEADYAAPPSAKGEAPEEPQPSAPVKDGHGE